MRLAVIDDDSGVQAAVGRLLRAFGHDVCLFSSAGDFELASPAVDCLIIDMRLPGVQGVEFYDQLKARGCRTPAVFITGDGDPLCSDAGRGTPPTLAKPFDCDALLAAIDRAVVTAPAQR
jgi:FixJ family two-component response regulator